VKAESGYSAIQPIEETLRKPKISKMQKYEENIFGWPGSGRAIESGWQPSGYGSLYRLFNGYNEKQPWRMSIQS
jgi:hypothetical protein